MKKHHKDNPQKLKYGLNITKAKPAQQLQQKSSVFQDETFSSGPNLISKNTSTSKLQTTNSGAANKKPRLENENNVDPSIYAYDEVYDAIKDAQAQSATPSSFSHSNESSNKDGHNGEKPKPRYIQNLINSASVRKIDLLKAKERKVQKEREAEGDQFAHLEKFVTSAYKEHLDSLNLFDEEGNAAASAPGSELDNSKKSFVDFFSNESNALVDTAKDAVRSENIRLDYREPKPHLDLDSKHGYQDDTSATKTARDTDSPGAQTKVLSTTTDPSLLLNDDNQVVDKRQLLKAGLNITAKPSSKSRAPHSRSHPSSYSSSSASSYSSSYRRSTHHDRNSDVRNERPTSPGVSSGSAHDKKDQSKEHLLTQGLTSTSLTTDKVESARLRYLQRKKKA
ncbi:Nuclear speckle splicing regulatory protein-like protein [Zancudomyces culisetae]|uniref:Nuclear speckle splicing regulatory protein-like protein n=1 Tax=Zancudomyces culisetae TaxID=1213189 RepID=A0A1R1PXZ9_ZANCU|nr:Nuclear speckle splicing regulatory protein-like protein [Zancudomyces culisetae]|eukprot:OMH85834.1 Nuclear speckle splicing regulatory protein-like protein [Zancudomyces culisetae]